MLRTDVINYIIKKMNYKTYLEIGVSDGNNYRNIECDKKIGVDPVKICNDVTHEMTSDEFFDKNQNKFDIIFIDGHHNSEYVCRDIMNSLKILENNGTIVVHDCYPNIKKASGRIEEYVFGTAWCGDGFKVINSIVKNYKNNIKCDVLNTDWGVGIIRKIAEEVPNIEYDFNYTWEQMMSNPEKEINLVELNVLSSLFEVT